MTDTNATKQWSALLVLLYLEMARVFKDNPAKAVVQTARQLLPLIPADIAHSTVIPIMGSVDPLQALDFRVDIWQKLKTSRDQFVEDGAHGLMIYEKVIYPIRLELEDEGDLEWAIEHELDLIGLTGEVYANENKLRCFDGHLMFFPEWGFSGELKALHSRRSDSAGKTSLMKLFTKGAVNKGTYRKKNG